ncbi:hypothetical protein M0657_011470 [Pyricularia oryzae]|nr:hypothetical protein M0657_011470 [Pyricularia oryzae]KAI7914878.1 hypothetical protein M9X92_008754 [Pyricularia oryzae]
MTSVVLNSHIMRTRSVVMPNGIFFRSQVSKTLQLLMIRPSVLPQLDAFASPSTWQQPTRHGERHWTSINVG